MTAPIDIAQFARSKGWAVDRTSRGRLRLSKDGSVVFVAASGASPAVIAEAVDRIGYIDGLMAKYRERRP